MGLYENVKTACAKRNTNVFRLEADLGFPRGSIYKWDVNIPSIAKVKDVSEALDVSMEELTRDVDFRRGEA